MIESITVAIIEHEGQGRICNLEARLLALAKFGRGPSLELGLKRMLQLL